MGRILTLLAVVAVLTGALAQVAQEPAGYIVAKVTINDEDTYGLYRAGFGAILRQYEGQLLAASRDPTIVEGEWSATTTVLLRFASREQALEWYNSEEYQELVQIRHAASTADIIAIDGRR